MTSREESAVSNVSLICLAGVLLFVGCVQERPPAHVIYGPRTNSPFSCVARYDTMTKAIGEHTRCTTTNECTTIQWFDESPERVCTSVNGSWWESPEAQNTLRAYIARCQPHGLPTDQGDCPASECIKGRCQVAER